MVDTPSDSQTTLHIELRPRTQIHQSGVLTPNSELEAGDEKQQGPWTPFW